ncbi:uncharacterized protein NPIL_312511 [Nephila pilipes]|uniref:Uncharacterized protein n=1 Tax=Nephila pilipes TaxID=299642 RepID=A0A8X6TNL8_NEPPI|nr:uncharacterized protein NPIL_312511 [Nephila pilipes]
MHRLPPPTIRHHGQSTIFASKNLTTCSHVFLRTNSMKKGLQPPYEGPYKIVNPTEKVFRILKHGKEVSVSVDRLKTAYFPKELVDISTGVHRKEKVPSQPNEVLDTKEENSIRSSSRQETTTRSGRIVRFNPKYN